MIVQTAAPVKLAVVGQRGQLEEKDDKAAQTRGGGREGRVDGDGGAAGRELSPD